MSMTCPDALREYLRIALHSPRLQVSRYERLSGGAIQQNVALDLVSDDDRPAIEAVLRTDSASSVQVSLSRLQEFAVLEAAFDSGVCVPRPLLKCMDTSIIGSPFFLMERVEGTAQPHQLTRKSPLDDEHRRQLVESIGRALARVHAVPLNDDRLSFLERPRTGNLLGQRVSFYRRCLDQLKAHRPVLEWALAWLDRQCLPDAPYTLCHNDFRTGNLMIQDQTLTGILDWEFAGIGDPHEDLGWFCAPCWRFARRDREAGGLGDRTDFYAAYERESGRTINHETVSVMEVLATIRWGVIALQQGSRFDSGQEPTLELGLTGRMIAELEQDLLYLLSDHSGRSLVDGPRKADHMSVSDAVLSDDTPHAHELLAAAHRHLLDELLPGTEGPGRYSALMIGNALSIAMAELQQRRSSDSTTLDNNAGLHLCRQLRDGVIDELLDDELQERLRSDVERRLSVANPKRLSS